MKRNFLRLCLMLGLLSLNSCGQDLLPEKQTYNNSGAFQLTSKKISLNEAKHKAKLISEIEQVENKFKTKGSTFEKVVNYGNGVSIDTDEVTYIENGPNYHTYTFNIKRENAPADAPVENLVLSPLTNGTYRELLFSYNLTSQEKQILMNGGFVDTKNKVTVTDLQKGTFNSGGQLAKNTVCTWTIDTHYTTCSEGLHSHGETAGSGKPGTGTFNAETLSQLIVLVVGDCKSIGDDGNPGGSTGPGTTSPGTTSPGTIGGLGGGTDDGSGNTDFPSNEPGNNCNGGLTAPQTPGYDISDGGCGGNIPTQPTLPTKSKTPCQKIKAKFADTKFKEKVTAIDKPEVFAGNSEMGYASGYPDANTGATETQYVLMENNPNTHKVKLPDGNQYFGYMHSHTNDTATEITIKIFSPLDVATFLTSCVSNADEHLSIGDAYAMVITSEGNYMLQYSGTGDYSIGQNQIDNWKAWYKKEYGTLIKYDKLTKSNVEKTFARFLSESVNIPGLEVYYVEKDTGKAFKINPDGTKTPCP